MYPIIKTLAIATSKFSPELIDRLARCIAVLIFDILRIRRRMILNNLEIAFGNEKSPDERRKIGRESTYHFILTFLEFLRSVRIDIHGETMCHGIEHVQNALKQGRGCYILCCHLGNWEAMGGSSKRFIDIPTYAIVKDIGGSGLNRFVEEIRNKNGLLTIRRDPPGRALRAVRDTLSRNQLVGFMLDQARPGAPRIPFFGMPAKTQTSLAAIWRKYPAPVIPVYIRRIGVGSHEIHALPELEIQHTNDSRNDVLNNTEMFNTVIERMIRSCPEQYFWMHNRWKE